MGQTSPPCLQSSAASVLPSAGPPRRWRLARSARLIGSWATVGWVMLIGVAIAVPATLVGGGGANLTPDALTLLAISGAGNIVGLLLAYTAFKAGKVAVIAPISQPRGRWAPSSRSRSASRWGLPPRSS